MSNKELLIETSNTNKNPFRLLNDTEQLELLLISSFPDRQCGIATFSQDLRNSLIEKFGNVLKISVCAIENEYTPNKIIDPVSFVLEANNPGSYKKLAENVKINSTIRGIIIQHEFGLFGGNYGNYLLYFLKNIDLPVFITFHTVLPNPSSERLEVVKEISRFALKVIVMSESSSLILQNEYQIDAQKIEIIAHGVHLTPFKNQELLKIKYQLENKKVFSTFGLLSEGKSIETALYALPEIVKKHPDCIYLILGKTHPEIFKREGEKYRTWLHLMWRKKKSATLYWSLPFGMRKQGIRFAPGACWIPLTFWLGAACLRRRRKPVRQQERRCVPSIPLATVSCSNAIIR
jgi:glycosyltransferase involved in cell wall biosynthesis